MSTCLLDSSMSFPFRFPAEAMLREMISILPDAAARWKTRLHNTRGFRPIQNILEEQGGGDIQISPLGGVAVSG
jgi:hypothetical protein